MPGEPHRPVRLRRDGPRDGGRVPGACDTAVALANGASERLRCGAEPLKPPKGDEKPVVA